MLLHEYGSYQQCPDELHVRIEAIESFFMTEVRVVVVFSNEKLNGFIFQELRPQFRSLGHLPLTCEFQVIEVRLHPPIISPTTMQVFTGKI